MQADLLLWIQILNHTSSKGIDINNITFTKETVVCISDACEHGIGGYNSDGLAWRWELPEHMKGKFTINLLEFLAAAITIEMTLQSTDTPQKVLSLTDSTSALGWLHKASFPESKPIHDKVARWLAIKLMEKESSLYSQHIAGKFNMIADSNFCGERQYTEWGSKFYPHSSQSYMKRIKVDALIFKGGAQTFNSHST